MLIKFAGVEPNKLQRLHLALQQIGCAKLTIDSRKDSLRAGIERLVVLFDYCQEEGIRQRYANKIDLMIAERDELLSDERQDRATFSIAMDFFWLLERLTKLIIKDLTLTETHEFSCKYPQAFQAWQTCHTAQAGLLPIHVKDTDQSQMINLGQKHSLTGIRRVTFLTPEQLQAVSSSLSEGITVALDDFLEAYQGVPAAPILPLQKVELAEEKNRLYTEMQDEFQALIYQLKQSWEQNIATEQAYLCWMHDDTLHDRLGMTFEHEERVASQSDAENPA